MLGSDKSCRSAYEAFEIPGWGGVVIHHRKPHDLPLIDTNASKKEMGYFVAHMRRLLGIKTAVSTTQVEFLPSVEDGVTDWEIDAACRSWTVRHLVSTTQTLKSIAKLVNEMPHMSVLERIQRNVEHSIAALQEVYSTIEKARNETSNPKFASILRLARTAAAYADAAYYDSTMVPQLYFPEEHLYAVYLPLLAPIVLPLVGSLRREYRRLKKKKELKASNTNSNQKED